MVKRHGGGFTLQVLTQRLGWREHDSERNFFLFPGIQSGYFLGLFCYDAAAQIALQLQQERKQVVCGRKEVQKRPTESYRTFAIDTWNRSCS